MVERGPEPAPETSPGSWRDDVNLASGLNIVAGIWLIISPFVLGYEAEDAIWNPIVCGVLVVALGLARVLVAQRAAILSAVNALIGVWLFISAFWLAASEQAIWNTWIMGVLVFILGVLSAAATPQRSAS